MNCPSCGAPVADESAVCDECGAEIQSEAVASGRARPPRRDDPAIRVPVGYALTFLAGVLAGAVLFGERPNGSGSPTQADSRPFPAHPEVVPGRKAPPLTPEMLEHAGLATEDRGETEAAHPESAPTPSAQPERATRD